MTDTSSAPPTGVQIQHQTALDAGRFLIQHCAACGNHVYFPREICPHCGGYMDIPDPDEDWSDVDFGAEEGDNGEAK